MNFDFELLHHETIEGKKPIVGCFFAVVHNGNGKLGLVESMLDLYDEEPFMEFESCPNILHLRLFYGESRLLIFVLKRK